MKSRLGALAVLAVLSSLLVAVLGSPAEAAAVSVRLSRTTPIAGEVVRVYGAVKKSPRVVRLQTLRRGHWANVRSARARKGGGYSFAVRAGSSTATYRVLAPRAGRKSATASSRVRVRGVRQQVTFAPPVALNGKTLAPATAIVTPARPGASVRLLRKSGNRFVTVKYGKQNAAGAVNFWVPVGSASAPYRYQAKAVVGTGISVAPSALSVPLSKTAFRDEFNSRTLSSQWKYRTQGYQSRRKCSTSGDRGTISLNGRVATFRVVRKKYGVPKSCRGGAYSTPMITSGSLAKPYGFYVARIKFQRDRGMHSAFWMQGGSEVDVAEHFGYHRPISNLIHNGAIDTGNFSVGSDRPQSRAILGRSTPYSGFHTYSVTWSPAGYVFRLDNVPTLVTSSKNTAMAAEIILSLQISDWEMPVLNPRTVSAASSSMQVDYVRAWQ